MGIVVRDMAWHTEGEKVRACDTTATIRPSKSGHKTTACDAHPVAVEFRRVEPQPYRVHHQSRCVYPGSPHPSQPPSLVPAG